MVAKMVVLKAVKMAALKVDYSAVRRAQQKAGKMVEHSVVK